MGDVETTAAEVGVLDMSEGATAMSVHSEAITIDALVATAKRFPRSVDAAIKEATAAACLDEVVAGTMTYTLPPRGNDGPITGPSARFAEILVQAWGNIRADIEPLEAKAKHVTAMATCYDVEKNVAVRVKVHRRITTKRGKRYGEDMIMTTFNAAASIAYRNAVLKVIPSGIWRRIWQESRKVAAGDAKTIGQRRQGALEWFSECGVTAAQVYKHLGVNGLDDITADRLLYLLGVAQAVRDGDTTLEMVFNPPRETEAAQELDQAIVAEVSEAPVANERASEAEASEGVERAVQDDAPKGRKRAKGLEQPDTSEQAARAETPEAAERDLDGLYRQAMRKATELSKIGALSDADAGRMDDYRDDNDYDALAALDAEFAEALEAVT